MSRLLEDWKVPLLGTVLVGSCIAALGASLATDSVFGMSILSVTVLAIVALVQGGLR